ncbi:hypothetical protein CBR_g36489 [Chara braunii]|uniref:LysM domain-containing protein n=1 Tax=Chara braunii TaxID=69332 RepID=A0A388LL52_CHABU|nr:hypothetical protein CBR_g36489 [Chara braunii]|eukprot:GBG82963.1 hypothetical protein CBR_g36489 [Chara braunii]
MASQAAVSGAPVGRVSLGCSRERSREEMGGTVRRQRMHRCACCGASLIPVQASTSFLSADPTRRHVAPLRLILAPGLSRLGSQSFASFTPRIRGSPTLSQQPARQTTTVRANVTTGTRSSADDSRINGPQQGIREHLVGNGDTLYGIARKYGCSVEAILKLNARTIEDPDDIYPREVLLIPAAPGPATNVTRPNAQSATQVTSAIGKTSGAQLVGKERVSVQSLWDEDRASASESDGKRKKQETSGDGPNKGSRLAVLKGAEKPPGSRTGGEAQAVRSAIQEVPEQKGSSRSSQADEGVRARADASSSGKVVPAARGREEVNKDRPLPSISVLEKAGGDAPAAKSPQQQIEDTAALNSPSAAAVWIQEVVANDPLVEVGPEMIAKRMGSSGSAQSSALQPSSLRGSASAGRSGKVSTTEALLPPMPPESFTVKKGALWGAGIAALLALLVYLYQRLRNSRSSSPRVIMQTRDIKPGSFDQPSTSAVPVTGGSLPQLDSDRQGWQVVRGPAGSGAVSMADEDEGEEKGRDLVSTLQPSDASRAKSHFQDVVLTRTGNVEDMKTETIQAYSAEELGESHALELDSSETEASLPHSGGNRQGIAATTATAAASETEASLPHYGGNQQGIAATAATAAVVGAVAAMDNDIAKPTSTTDNLSSTDGHSRTTVAAAGAVGASGVRETIDGDIAAAGKWFGASGVRETIDGDIPAQKPSAADDLSLPDSDVTDVQSAEANLSLSEQRSSGDATGLTEGHAAEEEITPQATGAPGAAEGVTSEDKLSETVDDADDESATVASRIGEAMERAVQAESDATYGREDVEGETVDDADASETVASRIGEAMESAVQAESDATYGWEDVDGGDDDEGNGVLVNGGDLTGVNGFDYTDDTDHGTGDGGSSGVQDEGYAVAVVQGRGREGEREEDQELGNGFSTVSTAAREEEVDDDEVRKGLVGDVVGSSLLADGVGRRDSLSAEAGADVAEHEDDLKGGQSGDEPDDDLEDYENDTREASLSAEEEEKETTSGNAVIRLTATEEEKEMEAAFPVDNRTPERGEEILYTDLDLTEVDEELRDALEEVAAAGDRFATARQDINKTVKAALPAIIFGVGGLGALAGVAGVLQVVGLAATATVASQVVWADSREKLVQDLMEIKDHKSLMEFLRARKLVKDS